jgi:glycosyltransferase involved in cell wall biosynthesis
MNRSISSHPTVTAAAATPSIAVLIPCHNEAATIGRVVAEFSAQLPGSTIYVYDNNSSDDTARLAADAGACVRHEPLQGKGNVVRRMFSDIEADIFLLVDGDGTYDPQCAPQLVDLIATQGLDMVNCTRVAVSESAFRPGHAFGNRLLTGLVAWIFGNRMSDILSGYRALSRRFVKSFPALSSGFEIETELTVHALEMRVPIGELPAPYRERPHGSASKLRTVHDGMRIFRLIVHLVKEERPLQFFTVIFFLLSLAALGLAWPVVQTYFATGLVPRLPTAVLATGMAILAALSLVCGFVLDTVTRGRRELKRLFYLSAGRPRKTFP